MRFLGTTLIVGCIALGGCSSADDVGPAGESAVATTGATGSGGATAAGPSTTSTAQATSSGSGSGDTATSSTGSTAATSGAGGASSGSGSGGSACNLHQALACDATPPDPGGKALWKNPLNFIVANAGNPNHRGRDLILAPSDAQWVLGQFNYGLTDQKLSGEAVDIYLLRDCGKQWEMLGTATTSSAGANPKVEGVDDTGGRVYFPIPAAKKLGVGRHRVHLVVKGDLSTTEQFIEVIAPGTKIVVSDVDGTLTTSEYVEFTALLSGTLPDAHPDAAAALGKLAAKGLVPFYLTARPEWLTQRTREFLDTRGFPPGIVHTTLSQTGALGASATSYKSGELAWVKSKGAAIEFAIGNQASDADAYDAANVMPLQHRIFFQLDDKHGGRRINAWSELLGDFDQLAPYCL